MGIGRGHSGNIDRANQEVLRRIYASQPTWVGVARALDVIPGMTERTILHAGPPISYERMCVPQRRAVQGALVYEGLAKDGRQADALARGGEIVIEPCHHHNAVGSMAGITSPSMFVNIVRNDTFGNQAYCAIPDSAERDRLSFGCFTDRALESLKWASDVLGPALDYAVRTLGGVDLKRIIARALNMGDECHSRNRAASALIGLELMPVWIEGGVERTKASAAAHFLAEAEQFFLPLSMASCKAVSDAVSGIEYSTIVTVIARNGVEVGIRVSGLGGEWFTSLSPAIEGVYFPGFGDRDANPDMGDSAITEAMGLGASAIAAAPGLEVVGGSLEKALAITREMGEITAGNNVSYPIPTLGGEGTPTGIDIRLVLEKNITPTINTGIAHKEGLGLIGTGNSSVPAESFQEALKAYARKYLD